MTDVGDNIPAGRFDFTDAAVAENFDEHVQHSVPGYHDAQKCMAALARHFVHAGSNIVDLGCATGSTVERMFDGGFVLPNDVGIHLVDESGEMLARAETKVRNVMEPANTPLFCNEHDFSDIHDVTWKTQNSASVIFCAFALQFVPKQDRAYCLQMMRDMLTNGGVLLLFEKTIPTIPELVDPLRQSHHDIKVIEGYTREQIAQKDAALRGVMHPQREDRLMQELYDAGFVVQPVWRSLMFGGYACLSR